MHRFYIPLISLLLLISTIHACKKEGLDSELDASRIVWISPDAPYTLTLPTGWQPFSPGVLDNGAEFSANHGDRMMMVFATPVPSSPASPDEPGEPDVPRYAKEGVAQLGRDVQDFEQIDIKESSLGTSPAVIVTAHGSVNERKSRYMIAYTGAPGWRFQVVAWAHHANAAELSSDFDVILSSWKLTPQRVLATDADAGHLHNGD